MTDAKGGRWEDLRTRVISAIVMVVIGLTDVLVGGIWFTALVGAVCAGILWECWTITKGDRGGVLALVSAAVLIGCWGLLEVRHSHGVVAFLWLVMVVIASDVAGYFAGRHFGGPKFWPSISPKKTWSGTVAGWGAAGLVGAGMALFTPATWAAVPLSMVTALAGQMGDIGQSAFKRRYGVKDSSNLIPGHGGLFDRFDALLGAALFLVLMSLGLWLAGRAV